MKLLILAEFLATMGDLSQMYYVLCSFPLKWIWSRSIETSVITLWNFTFVKYLAFWIELWLWMYCFNLWNGILFETLFQFMNCQYGSTLNVVSIYEGSTQTKPHLSQTYYSSNHQPSWRILHSVDISNLIKDQVGFKLTTLIPLRGQCDPTQPTQPLLLMTIKVK